MGQSVLVGQGVDVGNGAAVGVGVGVGMGVEVVRVAATRSWTVASSAASTSLVPRIPASTVAGTSGVGSLTVGRIEGSFPPLVQATAKATTAKINGITVLKFSLLRAIELPDGCPNCVEIIIRKY